MNRRLKPTTLSVLFDREEDGRWIAEVPELPGVLAYGRTRTGAAAAAKALALHVLADRMENSRRSHPLRSISFTPA